MHLKALRHDIRAIFSKINVTRDVTAPIRLKSGNHFSINAYSSQ